MEGRSKVAVGLSGLRRSSGPIDRPAQLADDQRLAQAARDELVLLGMPRMNVLLAGRDAVVSEVLKALLAHAHKPVTSWFPGEPLALPPSDEPSTIVLHDVGAMPLHDQIQLLEWLGRAMGRVQVVSTSSMVLLPRVRAGSFIDTLYYRLNTIYMDVTDEEQAA